MNINTYHVCAHFGRALVGEVQTNEIKSGSSQRAQRVMGKLYGMHVRLVVMCDYV